MNTTKGLPMNYVKPGANPEALRADLERRRSNAARPKASHKARRQGSRSSARNAAVRDAL